MSGCWFYCHFCNYRQRGYKGLEAHEQTEHPKEYHEAKCVELMDEATEHHLESMKATDL